MSLYVCASAAHVCRAGRVVGVLNVLTRQHMVSITALANCRRSCTSKPVLAQVLDGS